MRRAPARLASPARIAGVDALRGIAIVAMIAYHFEFDLRYYDTFDVPTGVGTPVTTCRNLCEGQVVARITFEN